MTEQRTNSCELYLTIGKRIKDRRTLLCMSQEKLGEKLGIAFQQVQKYENGKNRTSLQRLIDIASALETTVIDLAPELITIGGMSFDAIVSKIAQGVAAELARS